MAARNLFETQKKQCQQKLQNLSPQKYGKEAFHQNFYTPSRLFDNVLYKEVTTMRKVETAVSKMREMETTNNFLLEKLQQAKTEKEGIEDTLTQQIKMYKQMLKDQEAAFQHTLTTIQTKFAADIQIIIQDKETEIKFTQSQKESLQNQIQSLYDKIQQLQLQINNADGCNSANQNKISKLQLIIQNLQDKYTAYSAQKTNQLKKSKEQYQELSKRYGNAQLNWKAQVQNTISQKEIERANCQRILRTQIQKIESQRHSQNTSKSTQMKEMAATFSAQTQRLSQSIAMKDRMLASLNQENSKGKEHIIQLTKHYEAQLSTANHDRTHLDKQLTTLTAQLHGLRQEMEAADVNHQTIVEDMEACIDNLKSEVKFNQINYVDEKQKYFTCRNDFEQEIYHLRNENCKVMEVIKENDILIQEMRQLRELLLESSYQIQRSKEEIQHLSSLNEELHIKLDRYAMESESMYKKDMMYRDQAYGRRNDIFRY